MTEVAAPKRLIVAITGATGAIYGVRLLQVLRNISGVESHLLISEAGVLNLHQEMDLKRKDVEALADVVHNVRDVGASIASGSFLSDGMIIAPCSMKTLAAVAHGLSDNLITRAADVVLKERRRLVLMVRDHLPASARFLPSPAKHRRDGRPYPWSRTRHVCLAACINATLARP